MIMSFFQAYRNLPYKKKVWIARVLLPVKFVTTAVTSLIFQVYRISDDDGAVFITSIKPDTYFVRKFYPGATLKKTRTIFVWSLKSIIRRNERVIIEMHRNLVPFFKDGLITVPFVRQISGTGTPPENHKQFRKRKKNILKYAPEISKDPETLKFFYEKLYVPYIRGRHTDALIDDYSVLQYHAEKNNGEVLLLKREQEIIGGSFCTTIGDTYHGTYLGLIDDRYLREDAVSALFYFSLVRARELHARFMDFGDSRPFLLDGILGYKRMWGGHLTPNKSTNYYFYLKNVTKEGLIYLEHDKLTAQISRESAQSSQSYADSGVVVRIIDPLDQEQLPDYRRDPLPGTEKEFLRPYNG